jgi:hypothetical protein
VGKAQTWEVYDSKLNMLSRIEYDNINILSETVRLSSINQQLKLLNKEYKPFLTMKGQSIFQYLEPWIIVKGDKGYGAYHEYGEEIFPPIYDKIEISYTRLLAKKDNVYFVYDRPLKKVIELGSFDDAFLAKNGQVIAKYGEGFVLPMSSQPEKVIESIKEANNLFLIAKENSGFGLINREGKYVLEPIIDQLTYIENNSFFGFDGKEYMLIRAKDEKVDIPYTSYHRITLEPNGMMLEYIHGKLRRIMKSDGILLDIAGMEKVEKVADNHYYNVTFRDKTTGLYSLKGWEVSPTNQAEKIFPGSEGLYPAFKNGKFGFVNSNGRFVIQPKFEVVKNFSNEIAAVKTNGRWGYINKNDQIVINPTFDDAGDFNEELAIIKINNKSNLINKRGDFLLTEGYDRISLTDEGYFLTEENNLHGLIDFEGKEIVSPSYNEIRREHKNIILVRRGMKYGVMDESGNFELPLYYKNIIFDHSNLKILAEDLYKNKKMNKLSDKSKIEDKSKKIKKGA